MKIGKYYINNVIDIVLSNNIIQKGYYLRAYGGVSGTLDIIIFKEPSNAVIQIAVKEKDIEILEEKGLIQEVKEDKVLEERPKPLYEVGDLVDILQGLDNGIIAHRKYSILQGWLYYIKYIDENGLEIWTDDEEPVEESDISLVKDNYIEFETRVGLAVYNIKIEKLKK